MSMAKQFWWGSSEPSSGGSGGGGGAYKGNPSVRGLDIYLGETQDDYRGYTGFRLQELVAIGETNWAGEYVDWCFREMGANSVRWFCRWHNTGYCPETDPNFYDNFGKTLELCKRYGGYGHPVFSCDQVPGSRVLTTDEKLAESVRRMLDVCRVVGNTFPAEKENEPFKNGMKGRLWPTEWFNGVVWCPGTWNVSSNVNPFDEIGPWGPMQTVHPGGDREWVSEGGHLCHEVMHGALGDYAAPHVPCIVGEPVRIAEEGRTPEQFADHAWNCRNMGRGSLVHGGFHSLSPQTSHHASDLQNCRIPTSAQFPDALRACEAVRDVWRSKLWRKDSASQGRYVRASVAEPDDGVPGHVPGIGDTVVFPQTDQECPLEHWDRWIEPDGGPHYEDPRGTTRTYFMEMPDGSMIGGPLDRARDYQAHPRLRYVVSAHEGPIWVLKR